MSRHPTNHLLTLAHYLATRHETEAPHLSRRPGESLRQLQQELLSGRVGLIILQPLAPQCGVHMI